MWIPPLLIISFLAYNLFVFVLFGTEGAGWVTPVLSISMVSGAVWTLNIGDTLLIVSLVLLFLEVLKSTHTGKSSILEHMASTLLFVAFLVEFLVVPAASTSLFFIILVMSFIDVVAGFSVSIRAAERDISVS